MSQEPDKIDWSVFMDLPVSERMRMLQDEKQHDENRKYVVEREMDCLWLGT